MPRTRSISNFSLAELENLIDSQKSQLNKLRKQRMKLVHELNMLDRRINGIAGGRGLTAGGRARNAKSLVATLVEVLSRSSKPMQVTDIANAVLASGYRSSSDSFRAIVNQTLIKDKRFVAAERGKYQLKK